LRTLEIGDPARWPLCAQDVVEHALAAAGAEPRYTDRGMLTDPRPLGASVDPCPRFITADPPAAAPARQALREPGVQPGVDPRAAMRQRPFAEGHAIHRRHERRQARVTDGLGLPQIRRQRRERRPNRRAGLQPHRHRGDRGLATVGTRPGRRLYPGDDGPERWQLARVLPGVHVWLGRLDRAPTMRTGLGLGDAVLVGIRRPGPPPTRTAHTRCTTWPPRRACGEVRCGRLHRRHPRIVGVLARRVRFACECREPRVQALHLRPQGPHEGILFRRR